MLKKKCFWWTSFDHIFSRPARIELKFCTVAKLEELNNFCLDQNEGYPWKKVRFRDLRLYLARARARARARPALQSWGPQALTQKGDGGSSRWRARFCFSFAVRARQLNCKRNSICFQSLILKRQVLKSTFIIEEKLRPHKKSWPYGGTSHFRHFSSFKMM